MSSARFGLVCLAAFTSVSGTACDRRDKPAAPPATNAAPSAAQPTERVVGPLSPQEAEILAAMNEKVNDYVALHRKLEADLPQLPDAATPAQIDQNQRKLEAAVRAARKGAKRGDLITPEAARVIKRLLASVFGGPDGKELRASIMDEPPTGLKLVVNGRYPDEVPLSTIPPQVLQTLPKMAEEMEYRFVGDALILLDVHAHVIADYLPDAMPK
jgi:hypothetical protein